MKFFEVFKAGKYPQGKFTAEQIAELAKNYDPKFCEAPITLDHEQSGPAYGWVKSLKADGETLKASFKDVAEDLKSFVNDGKYRKISVEIYRNLEGKQPYLKAVSFLGAGIPQVKGMDAVEFKDGDSDIYTFEVQVEDDEDSNETQELKEQVQKLETKIAKFNEKPKESDTVKALKKQVKDLSSQVDTFKEQADGKADLEKEIKDLKFSMKSKEYNEFIEKKIEEGILTPANKDTVLKVLKDLDNVKKFDENSNTFEDFKTFISSLPKQIEFEEIATKNKKSDESKKGEFDEFANVSEESQELFEEATALAEKENIPFKAEQDYNTFLQLFLNENQISFDLTIDIVNEILENPYVLKCVEAKYPYILVDEYQDSTIAMHTMFKALLEKTNIKFIIVGDPNQSIYSFNEASPQYFNEFYRNSGFSSFELSKNYRCENNITEVANNFLNGESNPLACSDITCYYKYCKDGLRSQIDHISTNILINLEAENIERNKICILYRNVYSKEPIAEFLSSNNIKFIDQNKSYLHSENNDSEFVNWIEDIIFWLLKKTKNDENITFKSLFEYYYSFIHHKARSSLEKRNELKVNFYTSLLKVDIDNIQLIDFLNFIYEEFELESYISKFKTIDRNAVNDLCNYANKKKITVTEFLTEIEAPDAIRLLSLHSSKGLEFDAVIIPSFEKGIFPDYRASTDKEKAEERRLLFVAMTRTKKEFYILYSGFYTNKYGCFRNGPSPYVEELKDYFICCDD